jgi:hypothetical protein
MNRANTLTMIGFQAILGYFLKIGLLRAVDNPFLWVYKLWIRLNHGISMGFAIFAP